MLGFSENASLVLDNRLSVDSRRDRTTTVDFSHNLVAGALLVIFVVINQSKLRHSSVRKEVNLAALAAHPAEGIAGLASVGGVASGVNLVAKSFGTFRRASKVTVENQQRERERRELV